MDCFTTSVVYGEDFTDVFFICYHSVPGDAEWRSVGDLLLVYYLFIRVHLS